MAQTLVTSKSIVKKKSRENENEQRLDLKDGSDLEEAQSMDSTAGFGRDDGDEAQSIDSIGERLAV